MESENKFKIGDVVKHRKSGLYKVVGYGLLEENLKTYVAYTSVTTGQLWFRSKMLFEDGRFTGVGCNELINNGETNDQP